MTERERAEIKREERAKIKGERKGKMTEGEGWNRIEREERREGRGLGGNRCKRRKEREDD